MDDHAARPHDARGVARVAAAPTASTTRSPRSGPLSPWVEGLHAALSGEQGAALGIGLGDPEGADPGAACDERRGKPDRAAAQHQHRGGFRRLVEAREADADGVPGDGERLRERRPAAVRAVADREHVALGDRHVTRRRRRGAAAWR
jgi:hypothetical protein